MNHQTIKTTFAVLIAGYLLNKMFNVLDDVFETSTSIMNFMV